MLWLFARPKGQSEHTAGIYPPCRSMHDESPRCRGDPPTLSNLKKRVNENRFPTTAMFQSTTGNMVQPRCVQGNDSVPCKGFIFVVCRCPRGCFVGA